LTKSDKSKNETEEKIEGYNPREVPRDRMNPSEDYMVNLKARNKRT
jgi:hypothetical protein